MVDIKGKQYYLYPNDDNDVKKDQIKGNNFYPEDTQGASGNGDPGPQTQASRDDTARKRKQLETDGQDQNNNEEAEVTNQEDDAEEYLAVESPLRVSATAPAPIIQGSRIRAPRTGSLSAGVYKEPPTVEDSSEACLKKAHRDLAGIQKRIEREVKREEEKSEREEKRGLRGWWQNASETTEVQKRMQMSNSQRNENGWRLLNWQLRRNSATKDEPDNLFLPRSPHRDFASQAWPAIRHDESLGDCTARQLLFGLALGWDEAELARLNIVRLLTMFPAVLQYNTSYSFRHTNSRSLEPKTNKQTNKQKNDTKTEKNRYLKGISTGNRIEFRNPDQRI